jgi:hypothetical protein
MWLVLVLVADIGVWWCVGGLGAVKERENERKEIIFFTAFILPHDSISW